MMDHIILIGGARDAVCIQSVDNHGKTASISWKNPRLAPSSLVLAKVVDSEYDLPILIALLEDKPVVQFYQFGRADASLQVHLEEIMTSLAYCEHKRILIGGSGKGSVFLWDFSTGELLAKWQAHFKTVSRLLFSQDGELLVTGGGDGLVRAWCVSSLLCDSSAPQPYR
ncbi:hypothetical protein EON64_20505 [archaeon]|nr:MAG: hypothetical protein EON64_20505 [archaeon]